MAIMPVPTCCKLHAHNYTCIPIFLGRRGTPDPTGQLVVPRHGDAIGGNIKMLGIRLCVRACVRHKAC